MTSHHIIIIIVMITINTSLSLDTRRLWIHSWHFNSKNAQKLCIRSIIELLFLALFCIFLFITIIIRNTISARIDAFIIIYYWILLNRVKWDLHTCTWANENNIIWNGCCAEWIDEKTSIKVFPTGNSEEARHLHTIVLHQ